MKKTSRSTRRAIRHLGLAPRLVAAVALTLAGSARGAIDTWVGNTSVNWNAANWTGGNNPPVDGDSLVFGVAGTAGTILNNDLAAGFFVSGITFNAGGSAFTFNGNAITLAGPVANNGTNLQTINLPISLSATQTFTTTTGGATFSLME